MLCGVFFHLGVDGFQSFLDKVPNGNTLDKALGHEDSVNGGAPFNQFGLDFKSAGKTWTKDFCEKDSDGDGYTNGAELGDPCCVWTSAEDDSKLAKEGISHPGIKDEVPTNDALKNPVCQTDAPNGTTQSLYGHLVLCIGLLVLLQSL